MTRFAIPTASGAAWLISAAISSPFASNEVFGVRYVGVANQYGGMYVETSHTNGWPFYEFTPNKP